MAYDNQMVIDKAKEILVIGVQVLVLMFAVVLEDDVANRGSEGLALVSHGGLDLPAK
jgi:hypothetical protein